MCKHCGSSLSLSHRLPQVTLHKVVTSDVSRPSHKAHRATKSRPPIRRTTKPEANKRSCSLIVQGNGQMITQCQSNACVSCTTATQISHSSRISDSIPACTQGWYRHTKRSGNAVGYWYNITRSPHDSQPLPTQLNTWIGWSSPSRLSSQ